MSINITGRVTKPVYVIGEILHGREYSLFIECYEYFYRTVMCDAATDSNDELGLLRFLYRGLLCLALRIHRADELDRCRQGLTR